jgi:hypothetical protein
MNNELVRKEDRPHRDEMNLIEFPIGVVSERVPIDPSTGQEVRELVMQRTITDGGQMHEQKWVVRGHPDYGGLPRGFDLDVYNAIMTLWSRSDFQHRIISLGSIYQLLQMAGKSDQGGNYRRFHKAMDRLYGVMYEAHYAIYHPSMQQRLPRFRFKLLSSDTLKSFDETDRPRGLVRISEEFYMLVRQGYLKITDMDRYWRLPSTHARRIFQYLDKHRAHALRDQRGTFEINGYLLAKKLGTLDQTLQSYRPAKLRDIMAPSLDALKLDGYLLDYRWRKEGKGRSAVRLHVVFAPDEAQEAPTQLSKGEAAAVEEIGRLLDEPTNRFYHASVVRALGPATACRIARQVAQQAERRPMTTHKGRLFSFLAKKERERSTRQRAA